MIFNYGILKMNSVMKTYPCRYIFSYLGLVLLSIVSFTIEAKAQQKVPYQLSSHGDQSTVQVTANNFGSEARLFKFGPRGGQLVDRSIAPYAAHTYQVQCLSRNDTQETPLLDFALRQNSEDQYAQFSEWITRQDDPRKVIWNRGSYKSNNKLGKPLRNALERLYERPVRSIRNNTFLPHLSAWVRVEVFLSSLKALSELDEEQLFVLKMMVTAGSTLVIGTGDMAGDERLIQEFIPVGLGQVKPTGGALLEQLPQVSSYRTLFPRAGAYPIVIADNQPIAIESQLGLGKVRVLAVRLNELNTGEISNRVLKSDWTARAQLEEWLDLTMPPLTQSPRLLNDQIWPMLFLIPLIFFLARGRWSYIMIGSTCWVLLTIIKAPLFVPTSIKRAHLVYVPMGEGAITLAQVDLNSFDRGGRAESVKSEHLSLISAESQGACLIHTLKQLSTNGQSNDGQSQLKNESWWLINSELGERQRFKYISYAPSIPRVDQRQNVQYISDWPTGPWSGAKIEALAPLKSDFPIPADLKGIKAWRLPNKSDQVSPAALIYTYRTPKSEE